MYILDDKDRSILDLLQNDFPLAVQPYLEMANRIGLEEEELLSRIAEMKAKGLIRRIGGIIDSRNIGFYSTLCALTVSEARIETVAATINQLPGVTHNYLRDHDYNMWFTLTAPSRDDALKTLQELEILLGLTIMKMPAQKVFKIKVSFDMGVSNEL
ncbi:MAG: Lrp/AsnC family transcriptional regulator [Firmicutes bacterium HGW-Firmicutes-15]|nr:MAG: Lrp/AsnC family transcriptional regulator [Firmicutes bacterium HGW-Firmicutes-15]